MAPIMKTAWERRGLDPGDGGAGEPGEGEEGEREQGAADHGGVEAVLAAFRCRSLGV